MVHHSRALLDPDAILAAMEKRIDRLTIRAVILGRLGNREEAAEARIMAAKLQDLFHLLQSDHGPALSTQMNVH